MLRVIDWVEPAQAAAAFGTDTRIAWLDSAATGDPRAAWSFLCVAPVHVIEASDGVVRVDGARRGGDAGDAIARLLGPRRAPAPEMPFTGGLVGFLGYDLALGLDARPSRHPSLPGIPDMSLGLYDQVIGFDHLGRRCVVASPAAGLDALVHRLRDAVPRPAAAMPELHFEATTSSDAYRQAVLRMRALIGAGDMFQANLTALHIGHAPHALDPLGVHLALRARSPSPFAALLRCGPGLALSCASPERFVRLDGATGTLETRPIKGTRPRDADPATDRALAADLLASVKDRAENLMIVDLMRNDLGRVARLGSVTVETLAGLESFASVHHLVSVVSATLREGLGPVDVLRAVFPGGSITGAPKIRAIEVIDQIETERRGPYCGAIVRIGHDGSMDSAITIRTLVLAGDQVRAQAGGAVTAMSDPAEEYDEMRVKLAPLLAVFGA